MIGAMADKMEKLRKHKWVYSYGNGKVEGDPTMKNLLGLKGVYLVEMTSIGVPVPPGFTITTEVCNYYYNTIINILMIFGSSFQSYGKNRSL